MTSPLETAGPAEVWRSGPRGLLLAVLLVAVVVALFPALRAEFVHDDRLVVQRNPAVADPDLGALLARPVWSGAGSGAETEVGYWRPLASLILALSHASAGPSPAAFHALSVSLHLAACLAAFALVRRIARGDTVAWFAALLFGLHPAHVESVAWISAIGDPLAGLLALLALERHVAWRQRASVGSPWSAGVLLFLALLAKELAVGAFAAIVAMDLALGFRPRSWRAWIPYAAALTIWWLARTIVFQSALAGFDRTTTDFGVPASRLLLLRGEILGQGLALLAWPADLRPFHPFVPDPSQAGLLLPFAALALWAGACALLWRRGERALLVAVVLALVPLAPLVARVEALGIFPLADRYLYLAVIGVALLLSLLAFRLLPRPLAIWALALVALSYGVRTHVQARIWRDDETLIRAAVAASPRVPHARWQLGRILLQEFRATGDPNVLDEARGQFETALGLLTEAARGDGSIFAVVDDHVQANVGAGWTTLYGLELEGEGDWGPAKTVFQMVVERYPASAEGWAGLGIVEIKRGDLDAAQRALERALSLDDRFVEAHRNLGRLWLRRGDPARARASFEAALRWEPDQIESLLLLGAAHENAGEDGRALEVFQRAARLHPRDPRPLVQLAILDGKRGDLASALRRLDLAIELDPSDASAHLERGKVRNQRGERNAALESFQRACELAVRSFEAHYNAAMLLIEMQGVPQAMPYLIRAYENRPSNQDGERLAEYVRDLPVASPEAFLLFATADADRGLVDSALRWIEDALTLRPDDGRALYLKGGMLKEKGDADAARAAWERASELLPDNFAVHDSLAGLLMQLEDRAGALRHLEKALEILRRAAATDRTLLEPLQQLRQRIEELRKDG